MKRNDSLLSKLYYQALPKAKEGGNYFNKYKVPVNNTPEKRIDPILSFFNGGFLMPAREGGNINFPSEMGYRAPRMNNGGGLIVDSRGQWAHPGKNTRVISPNITMDGVPYPVLAKANNGQQRMMYPGQQYSFPGADYVDEYPMMKKGGQKCPKGYINIDGKCIKLDSQEYIDMLDKGQVGTMEGDTFWGNKSTLQPVTIHGSKDKGTNEFYKKLAQVHSPEAYEALLELGQKYGSPYVSINDKPGFFDPEYPEGSPNAGKYRPTFNPFTGNMTLGDSPGNLDDAYIAELAHRKQWLDKGPTDFQLRGIKQFPRIIKNFLDPNKKGYEEEYDIPGSIEYEAHEEIEPKLQKEYDDLYWKKMDESTYYKYPGTNSYWKPTKTYKNGGWLDNKEVGELEKYQTKGEVTYTHEPGKEGSYRLQRTVSPFLSNRDIRRYTQTPTSPRQVNFVQNYAGAIGSQDNPEFNYPTQVPIEGKKHWNIDRFIIDPQFSNRNLPNQESLQQNRANTLADMYKYYMLQDPEHKRKAFRQAKRFVRREIDPKIKGPFLQSYNTVGTKNEDYFQGGYQGPQNFDRQNHIRDLYVRELLDETGQKKVTQEELDKLKDVSFDFFKNYAGMSRKQSKEQWKKWQEESDADKADYYQRAGLNQKKYGGGLQQYQVAGQVKINPAIYTDDPKDPRFRSYNDSLNLYKQSLNNMFSEKLHGVDSFYKNMGFVSFKDAPIELNFPSAFEKNDRFYPFMLNDPNKKNVIFNETIKPIGFNLRYETGTNNKLYSSIYKKPVQPYILKQKSKPQIKLQSKLVESTLKPKPFVPATKLPMGQPSMGMQIQQRTFPKLNIPPMQKGHYRVEYFDPELKQETHRLFPTQEASDAFAKELGQRNLSGVPAAGNITQRYEFKYGGGLLSRTVTCSNCGWSWKAVDGGIDPTTCHKCGGMIKMQNGGGLTPEELASFQPKHPIDLHLPKYKQPKPFFTGYGFSQNPVANVDVHGVGLYGTGNINDRLNLSGSVNSASVFYPGGEKMFMNPRFEVGMKYKFDNGGDISIPDLQEGNWLKAYGPGGQTTDGCPPNFYKNAQGKCVPEYNLNFREPPLANSNSYIQQQQLQRFNNTKRVEDNKLKNKILNQPQLRQARKLSEPEQRQEDERRYELNKQYAKQTGNKFNYKTGDVASKNDKTANRGDWGNVHTPELIQSFAGLTPSGSEELGNIGASTFVNMNPITGPAASAGRLTQAALGQNPYGFDNSGISWNNALAGLGVLGDATFAYAGLKPAKPYKINPTKLKQNPVIRKAKNTSNLVMTDEEMAQAMREIEEANINPKDLKLNKTPSEQELIERARLKSLFNKSDNPNAPEITPEQYKKSLKDRELKAQAGDILRREGQPDPRTGGWSPTNNPETNRMVGLAQYGKPQKLTNLDFVSGESLMNEKIYNTEYYKRLKNYMSLGFDAQTAAKKATQKTLDILKNNTDYDFQLGLERNLQKLTRGSNTYNPFSKDFRPEFLWSQKPLGSQAKGVMRANPSGIMDANFSINDLNIKVFGDRMPGFNNQNNINLSSIKYHEDLLKIAKDPAVILKIKEKLGKLYQKIPNNIPEGTPYTGTKAFNTITPNKFGGTTSTFFATGGVTSPQICYDPKTGKVIPCKPGAHKTWIFTENPAITAPEDELPRRIIGDEYLSREDVIKDNEFTKEAEDLKNYLIKNQPGEDIEIYPTYKSDKNDRVTTTNRGKTLNEILRGSDAKTRLAFMAHHGSNLFGSPAGNLGKKLQATTYDNCYLGSCWSGDIAASDEFKGLSNFNFRPGYGDMYNSPDGKEGLPWFGVNPNKNSQTGEAGVNNAFFNTTNDIDALNNLYKQERSVEDKIDDLYRKNKNSDIYLSDKRNPFNKDYESLSAQLHNLRSKVGSAQKIFVGNPKKGREYDILNPTNGPHIGTGTRWNTLFLGDEDFDDTPMNNTQNRFRYEDGGSLPKAQKGKTVVTNPNDPKLKAYNDSLNVYNSGEKAYKALKNSGEWDLDSEKTISYKEYVDDYNNGRDNFSWFNDGTGKYMHPTKVNKFKGEGFFGFLDYANQARYKKPEQEVIYQLPIQNQLKPTIKKPVQPVVLQKKPKPEQEYPLVNKNIYKPKLKPGRITVPQMVTDEVAPLITQPRFPKGDYNYIFGPANSVIGRNYNGQFYSEDMPNQRGGVNQPDLDLLNNPEALKKYVQNKGLKFAIGGALPKAQNGFGCTGKSKCITGSDQKKKDGISGGYIGGTDNIVPPSNAPINYDELTKYIDDQYTDRSSKKQRQAEYAQAAQLYPGLTKNDFYASQGEASRLNSRINDIPTWDKPENQTYDRAWYPYYRSIIQPGVKVNSSQILKFISGQPGGIGGYRQTVESNYGLKKNKYGGWLNEYQGGGEEPLTKSSADWYKQWYEQRKTLPQFSRVAGERLNLLSTLPKVQLTPLEELHKSGAVAQYQKTPGDDASQDIISLADPATVPAFAKKIGKSVDVNIGTNPSVVGHEMSHWFDARANQSIFKPRGISKSEPYQKYPFIKPSSLKNSNLGLQTYKWITSEDASQFGPGIKTEVNSVLNELRKKEGFRGDQPTTPEQLQKIIDKYMNLPESDLDGGTPNGSQNQLIRTLIKYMGEDPKKLSELNNRIVAIQKEDVPIAKHGGWLSKYDEGGPGPKKNTLKQAAEKGKQFNKDWMNSPMYKQMLETSMGANSFYDINKIAANQMAIDRKYQLENSQWGVGPKDPGNSEGTVATADTWKPWGVPLAGSPINYLSNFQTYPDAIPYVNFVKGVVGQRGDDLNSNAVHEFSHVSDASGQFIPKSDKELMAKYAARLGFQNSLVFEKPFSRKKFVDKEKEWYDYVRDPSETRARLIDFRMRAKDQGLYDPFTQKFDIKYLKNYKEIVPLPNKGGYDPLNQLRDIYTDEEISDMLNKVAKSDNVQPQTMVKYGGASTGWLGKYETGSEVTETTTTVKPGWSLMGNVPEWNANGTSTIKKPVVKKVTETPKKLPQKSYVGRPATQEEWENSNKRQVTATGAYRIPTDAEWENVQRKKGININTGRTIAPGWNLGGGDKVAVTQPSLTEEQKFQFENPYTTPNPNLNTSVPGTPEYWWSEAGWNPEKQQTTVGMGAFARLYPQFATPDSDREWTTLPDGRSAWKKRVHPWQIPGTPQFKALTEINELEKEKNMLIGKTAIQLADPTGVSMWGDTWDSYKELYNNPSVWNATLAGVNTVASLPVIKYAGEEFMIPVKGAEATAKVAQITSKLEKLYTKYPQLNKLQKTKNAVTTAGKTFVGKGKQALNYIGNSKVGQVLHYVGGEPFMKYFDKATGAEKLFKLPTTGTIQSFNKMERFGKATVNFPINMYTANQDIKNLKISSKETPEEYFNFKREDGSIFQINAEIQNKHLPGSIPDDAIDPDWNREGVIIPLMTEKKLKDRQIYIPAMYNTSQKTQQKLKKLPNKK